VDFSDIPTLNNECIHDDDEEEEEEEGFFFLLLPPPRRHHHHLIAAAAAFGFTVDLLLLAIFTKMTTPLHEKHAMVPLRFAHTTIGERLK
jgi:hypothetical protein